MAIIRSRDLLTDENDIPILLIASCIQEHQGSLGRLNKLDDYYQGKHAILAREDSGNGLPNNKLVNNHAKYITDIATGYVLGNPVKYDGKQIDDILEVYKQIDIVSHDSEIGKDLSIFGAALELHYMSSDEVPIPKVACIDPRQIFLVVDDTVEYKPMFGVHYYEKRDIDNETIGWNVNVYTRDKILRYFVGKLDSDDYAEVEDGEGEHFYGAVPIIEFSNNEEQQGDAEQVLSLIDAYNVLQSDRINDKEQLVDAILMVKGMSFGDDYGEASQTVRLLKELKVLEMPDSNADAGWLVKQLNETEVEVLRKSIADDISKYSLVPSLTDENFAAQASGVAMKYKLFGLEQLAVIKERYFKQGLRERLAMFSRSLSVKGKAVEVSDATITMNRNLPANDLETATLISTLANNVSNETLIAQLSFVDDAKEENKKVILERKEDLKQQQAAFGFPMGVNPDDADEDEDVNPNEDEE